MAGNFYLKHSRTDHMKNSFSRIGAKTWNRYGIAFPTVIMLYLNIYLRIPYRVGYWTFYVDVPTLIDIFSKY